MTETKAKRPWFRFSLRTLLMTVAFATLELLIEQLAIGQDNTLPPVTTEAIVAKWKERDQYFRSFICICNGTHFEVDTLSGLGMRQNNDEKVPDDLSHHRRKFVLAADGRNRMEEEGRNWDESKKLFASRRTVDVFDGKSRNILFDEDKPHAFLHAARDIFADAAASSALRLALCPFRLAGAGDFGAADLVLTEEKATVDNKPTLVLKSGDKKLGGVGPPAFLSHLIWVDPNMDFAPVRREQRINGVARKTDETSYVHDKTHGWIPSRWTTTLSGLDGKTTWLETMTVEELSINKPIDDSEFELLLPVGTEVTDYTNKKVHVVSGSVERVPAAPRPAEQKALNTDHGPEKLK
jgi:hypothetical protein